MQVNVNNQNQRPTNGMNGQPMGDMHHSRPSSSRLPWIILTVVVVLFLAVGAYLFRDKIFHKASGGNLSGYQAVFLTNGQVYFGKLTHMNGDYVTLTDIYYLQVNQELQPTGNSTTGQTQTQPAGNQPNQPQLSLVKLGNELHGPTDVMQINRSQVLFYEDLKADGKVAQAIASYKGNK